MASATELSAENMKEMILISPHHVHFVTVSGEEAKLLCLTVSFFFFLINFI